MRTVYALSDKGARECAAVRATLPAQLHDLLRMVDGRRTREELLAAVGKNALTVGGLRWLTASGYIHASEYAPLADEPEMAGVSALAPESAVLSPHAEDELPRDADNVCHALANFMLRCIRRHLGQYAYQRQIEAATTLEMLLPHLHPLIDAIVVRAGPEAGAEFADTAAFLLQPPRRARR